MSNPVRVVYDNAADRASTSVNGVSVLPVGALKTNSKNEVWRTSAGTVSVTFTSTWTSPIKVSCVAFPFSNFSDSATMRVRLYSDMACTALLTDTTAVLCAQGAGQIVAGLTAAQSASAYSYAGGAAATVYPTLTAGVQGMKLDVVDTSNLQGWLEAARLVVGEYWSPMYNAEYGASITLEDTTENYRTDAGNLLSDVGTRHKVLSMTLSFMQPQDRANLWKLVKAVGKSQPVFISLFPGHEDRSQEQEFTVYGKFSSMSQIAATNYLIFSAPLELESL